MNSLDYEFNIRIDFSKKDILLLCFKVKIDQARKQRGLREASPPKSFESIRKMEKSKEKNFMIKIQPLMKKIAKYS